MTPQEESDMRVIATVELSEEYIDGLRDMLHDRSTIPRDEQEHLMATAKERHDALVAQWRADPKTIDMVRRKE